MVKKSQRSESKLEFQHNYYELRKEVTDLVLNDFGFREDIYNEMIDKYREANSSNINVDEIVDRFKLKRDSFQKWFIDDEGKAIIDILRNIETEICIGNSIQPENSAAKLVEWIFRRHHFNKAIGYCYSLSQELQYAIVTLGVDLNKYTRISNMINKEIALITGVKKADHRFLRSKEDNEKDKIIIEDEINTIFESIRRALFKIFSLDKK